MKNRKLTTDCVDFVDDLNLHILLNESHATDNVRLSEILDRSLAKCPLSVAETAALLCADQPEQIEEICDVARRLKKDVYGNRIVLFAPLYVGNECVNDCSYCGFRRSNLTMQRETLNSELLEQQVQALEDVGHKRLILVFGEHPKYDAAFIAEAVNNVYAVHRGHGEIRRVNINAAPMDHAGFKQVHEAGIGTFQIFQESYHHATYARIHPRGTLKSDYLYRLDSLSRAMESGCDDVGIGALFGMYDWRFEVLAMVAHGLHLMGRYGVGPHTISFPRLQPAAGVGKEFPWLVSDRDFLRLIAILRCAVPYTGLILTARESKSIRRSAMDLGVSQMDAGSKIEMGGYTRRQGTQHLDREQFSLGDIRELDEVIHDLLQHNHIPSFCTACYRLGRTGEEFMEYAIPGFIEQYCTPNALLTLCEYLEDYASPQTRLAGDSCICKAMATISPGPLKNKLSQRLVKLRQSPVRDLYF